MEKVGKRKIFVKTKTIRQLYTKVLKPILFLCNPEPVHNTFTKIGAFFGQFNWARQLTHYLFYYENSALEQTVCGIHFKNPVGLSAGFDKDAELVNILPHVGFGFMSIGSVTAKPYAGNARPWLYRLPKSKSILVNFGLKNIGVTKIIAKLKQSQKTFPWLISIAKTNCKENADIHAGINDYAESLKALEKNGVGDIYELNISCPNAYGGESFTTPERLEMLLSKITTLGLTKPIMLKMPINLPWNEFKKLLDVSISFNIAGVIIGNLNKDRASAEIKDEIPAGLKGNLSGKPTWDLSNTLISETYKYCGRKLVIVGVGGIFSPKDTYEKIKRGATLVQLITGMIFEGPALIGDINCDLAELLEKDGFKSISEAVGSFYD